MGIFGNAFGWPHLLIILVIILVIFGGAKLPGLAKGLGQSIKIFKSEVKTPETERKTQRVVDGEPVVAVSSEDVPSSTDAQAKPKL